MSIKVISIFEKETDPNGIYVNTTSKAENDWQRDLSPFHLGPCDLYDGYVGKNMENSWQYSKVYPEHADANDMPTEKYTKWAEAGWANPRAVRYPMGKGRIPLYSWWDGEKLGYIEARKRIYAPLYARAVLQTAGFKHLQELVNQGKTIYLKDYDAYRHEDLNMTLTDVLNYPKKKMGHAFVLMMLLTEDEALNQCAL